MDASDTAVPFANLALQWQQIRDRALPDLGRLFDSSAFCLGPWVEDFERRIAATPSASIQAVRRCIWR